MELNVQQPEKKKQKLKDAPVAVYRIIEVPPNLEGVAKTATIQIVPKVYKDETSKVGDKVNVTVTTSLVIDEYSSMKQQSTSQVIRLPVIVHKRQHKGTDGSDVSGSRTEYPEKVFLCIICEKTFKNSSYLKRHVNTHTGERIYKCDLCEKTFLDPSTLSRHRKIHSGDMPWSCKICKKSFGTIGSLRRHMTVHNQVGRPYQCETCLKRFPDNSSYQKHKVIHTGIKPHACDICGKAFVHIGDVNGHRKIHVGVKPYNCDRCGKDFVKHSNYTRHLLVHEGDKYFTCSICGVSYNFQGSLTRHILTHARRGNKLAIDGLLESNSRNSSSEENADADLLDKDNLDESETPFEKSKKGILLKVTQTKMKDLHKFKNFHKLKKALNPKPQKSGTEDRAAKDDSGKAEFEIPPGMPECDPHDHTILPPQDEIISKEITTEDAASLSTVPEDFGSTKDIPPPLVPSNPQKSETEDPAAKGDSDKAEFEIPPGMPECDPGDPTILLRQDEIISKQITTEDAALLLTVPEDFGSTKDIPPPLLPSSIANSVVFIPSSSESEYVLYGDENNRVLSAVGISGNGDAVISDSGNIITLISLTKDSIQVKGTSNKQLSVAGSSNSNVLVTVLDDDDDNGGNETIVPDSLNIKELFTGKRQSTSKGHQMDPICAELNNEELTLLRKAAKMVLSYKTI